LAAEKKPTIWTRNFICVLIINALLVLSHNSVHTLVSTYATYLGAGPKLMGLLTGMFFGVALAMRPVAGPITTRMDYRRLMLCVYAIGCVVNLGYAAFHTIPLFVIFRFFNGVQYAFVGTLSITIAADSLPAEKMSSGLGIFGVSGAVATSIAPQVGIWLHDWGAALRGEDFGFTMVFLFAAAMLGLALIPCLLMTPEHKDKAAVATLGKWYQTIASKNAIFPSIIMLLLIISYSLFNAYMVPYGEEIGVKNVGLFFTVLSIIMLGSRPISGKLTDRYGVKAVFFPGAILYALCFLAIGMAKGLPLILLGALLAALGYGSLNPAVQGLCMQLEPKALRPVASNTMFIGMDIGFFFGPLIGGFIRDVSTYRSVMLFGILPILVSIVVFLLGWSSAKARVDTVREIEKTNAI